MMCLKERINSLMNTVYSIAIGSQLEHSLFLGYFMRTIEYIAGSSKGRTSLSESENFGSIPSPAAKYSVAV